MLSEGMRKGCTRKAITKSAAMMTMRVERTVSSRCGSTKWMGRWRVEVERVEAATTGDAGAGTLKR
jgi:hypothetical protein